MATIIPLGRLKFGHFGYNPSRNSTHRYFRHDIFAACSYFGLPNLLQSEHTHRIATQGTDIYNANGSTCKWGLVGLTALPMYMDM